MKNFTLIATLALMFLVSLKTSAQQGFGTNQPDKSAAVDIVSSKRGLLIPRVELTNTTSPNPVTAPAESLMVYNKATAGDVTPGFYYWETGKWVRFVASDSEKTVTVSQGENITVTPVVTGNDTDYEVSVKGGTEGYVLVSNATGGTEWVDPSDFINDVITVNNGLTIDANNNVQLGGTLINPTEINTDLTNTLAINGLETISTTFDATEHKIVVMGSDGVLKLTNISTLVEASETVTNILDNGDGTFTYTNEGGTDVTFSANTTTAAVANGVYTFKDGAGVEIIAIDTNALAIAYDDSISGLGVDNVQAAIDELVTNLGNTTDILLDNGNGTFTHTAVDGTVVTFSANTTTVTEANGVYTFTDEAGVQITEIDTKAIASGYDNTASGLTADNVQAAIDELVTNTVDADNGITKTGNNIQLGGALIAPTAITADATNTLAIEGLQNSAANSANIVLVDETTGVLRNVARSLEATASGSTFAVSSMSGYNKFVPEITILATIGTSDLDITLPAAGDAKGQVINVKIANTAEPDAYVNIPNVDGVTIYGSLPFQSWIIKSNGSAWSVVGRN